MRVIYTSKGMSKKFWGARYTLGARYLLKNTVIHNSNQNARYNCPKLFWGVVLVRAIKEDFENSKTRSLW